MRTPDVPTPRGRGSIGCWIRALRDPENGVEDRFLGRGSPTNEYSTTRQSMGQCRASDPGQIRPRHGHRPLPGDDRQSRVSSASREARGATEF